MKPKVLICAFACIGAPDRRFGFTESGEGVLGWNIVGQLDRFCESFVLTHNQNHKLIENRLLTNHLLNTKFYYISLPGWIEKLQGFHVGVQIYAYIWQIKAYFFAKKLNKEQKFDVFHHLTYANDWMVSFIGALLPVPYIRGPGGGAHYVPKEFVKKYTLKERLAEKVRSVGQWMFRHDPFFIIGQNKARAILVCNKESFNALNKDWQKKAQFFPVNGISSEDFLLFKKQEKNIKNKFLVITAGKLIKIKGFDLAIKAFKNFSGKVEEAELIIIGNGPELVNLKKLTLELSIEEKVIFLGWLPRGELLQKMSSCDVFLFSSLRDGGGNVVVEAMAAGKPVVCFDLAGPGFHIDEKCGIKIKPENPEQAIEDMAKALEKLYSNRELRIKLGKGAEEKAEKKYDWNKLGDRLSEIYKKIL